MKQKPNFSIVVITRDEARTLTRLLRTLEEFIARGGDLVVVDTGSADATVQVAKQAHCGVDAVGNRFDIRLDDIQVNKIQRHFAENGEGPFLQVGQRVFHFANARNYAATKARYNFVLQVDASDQVLAFDIDLLNEKIGAGAVDHFTYPLYHAGDRTGSTITLDISRFYDRRAWHWEGYVHEALYLNDSSNRMAEHGLSLTGSQLRIHHIKNETKSRPSYLGGLALSLIEDSKNPRWLHYLGRELYYGGWHRSAIALLEKHAAREDAWNAERCESLCLAGASYEWVKEFENARAAYSSAFHLDSTRREPLIRLAQLCQNQGDFQASAAFAATALTIPRTSAFAEFEGNYTYIPHAILYWNLFWLNRKAEARQHWECCLQLAPDIPRFRQDASLFE